MSTYCLPEVVWKAPVLVSLRGDELKHCHSVLCKGRIGLEVGDFASPNLLDGTWLEQLSSTRELIAQYSGPMSLHGPFLDLNPVSPEPGLRRLTSERYRQALQAASTLGARHLVLHTQFNCNLRQPDYPGNWIAGNMRFWEKLLPQAEAAGITILLENMWDPCPDFLAELLARVDSPWLKACLDTGHANLFSRVPLTTWAETLGDHLVHLHLSDNRGGWDEHLAAGAGSIDFAPLLTRLAQRSAPPWLVLEVPRYSQVADSLGYLGWSKLLDQESQVHKIFTSSTH